jgi:hypothetical protein
MSRKRLVLAVLTILVLLSACAPEPNGGWDRTATSVGGVCEMTGGKEVDSYQQLLRGGQVLKFEIISEAGYTRAQVTEHQNATQTFNLAGETIDSNKGWIFSYKEPGPLGKVYQRRLIGFCNKNGTAKIRVIDKY